MSRAPRYYQVRGGERYTVTPRFAEACCDCGMVHHVRVRVLDADGRVVRGARVEFRTQRAPRLTRLERAARRVSAVRT